MNSTEMPTVRYGTPDQRVQITEQYTGVVVYDGPGPIPEGLLENGKSYSLGSMSWPISVRYEWPAGELAELGFTSSRRNRLGLAGRLVCVRLRRSGRRVTHRLFPHSRTSSLR